MNNRLEEFVRDHREEFDTEEPDNAIWDKISREIDPDKKKPAAPVVRLRPVVLRWTAIAAIFLLIAGALWYLKSGKGATQPAIVRQDNNRNTPDTGTKNATGSDSPNLAQTPAVANPNTRTTTPDNNPTLATIRPDDSKGGEKKGSELEANMSEEMYHYAKLVEIRHKELKTIEKDEPLLYKQFALDVNKLDSVYHNLQEQLPKNPNREQLLEAMLQNLQLQMELLNHQLEIIKQINHSKKTEYEKAYKTA